MIRFIVLSIPILFTSFLNCQSNTASQLKQNTSNTNISVEVLAQNLTVPWGMDFLPDGRLIFNERPGYINILNTQTKELKRIATRDISARSEGGLLGLVVDPQFISNHFIFIYETIETGNRIVRMKLQNDSIWEDKILVDSIPKKQFHDGGIVRFGPDGYLYAGTGDARDPQSAQDVNSLSGKILRMDRNGNIPADNPFNSFVWSYGHRNVQGLSWDTKGNMYASEHGPTGEINGWCCHDELNLIVKGGNYGWPFVIGDDKKSGTILPIIQSGDDTWAPGGIVFVQKNPVSKTADNVIITACLRGEKLIVFAPSPITNPTNESIGVAKIDTIYFDKTYGRLRNIIQAADGSLIFCSSNRDGRGNPLNGDDKIYRITAK